jgi:acetyl esterase/lipase
MWKPLAAVCLLFFAACAPLDPGRSEAGNWLTVLSNVTGTSDTVRLAGFAYGSDPRQRLDVYVPQVALSKPRPVLVFGYGGGFTDGKRDEYRFAGEAFASLGFVTVVYDYRLHPQVSFPTYLQDAARAVRWTHDYAYRFNGDAQRLVLAGHSAGAYMAAMLAVNPAYLEGVGLRPKDLNLVVCLSGGYDFYDPARPEHDGFISDDIAKVMLPGTTQTQPIRFVSKDAPPFVIFHGRQDRVLPVDQAQRFVRALRAVGDAPEYLEYDLDHASTVTTLAAPLRGLSGVYADLKRALQQRGLLEP